ncbi:hypothetical protein PLESTB_000813200 [Pleodorina starrii]|uniref:Uncharacterized protein n=1 Tax=Pleodorina starrii TaxID=330485 RepID=A0A9W6F326_9CHLO|nr:hypothetical protein PLESTB_000813200 [Pleodorina starrii]
MGWERDDTAPRRPTIASTTTTCKCRQPEANTDGRNHGPVANMNKPGSSSSSSTHDQYGNSFTAMLRRSTPLFFATHLSSPPFLLLPGQSTLPCHFHMLLLLLLLIRLDPA